MVGENPSSTSFHHLLLEDQCQRKVGIGVDFIV